MKKFKVIFLLAIFTAALHAGNDPYVEAIGQGKQMLSEAQTIEDFKACANKFIRISNVEKDQWHSYYYATYALIIVAILEPELKMKDATFDRAQKLITQMIELEHDEVEVLALQGFIHMLRISVDPASRGQKYSGLSAVSLQKARAIDAENPRVIYLLGQLSDGTSKFFGSDSTEACKLNESALKKFIEEENSGVDPILPGWGKNMALEFKQKCAS